MPAEQDVLRPPSFSAMGDALLTAGVSQVLPHDQLQAKLDEKRPLRIKLGIDPTAPDLHLGHTIVLDRLRAFQDAGHSVCLIIGDFTAKIGDPTGRNVSRPVLTDEQIREAADAFSVQAFKVLDRERTELMFNSSWLNMQFADVLRLGRHVTVAQMIERDDFAKRLAGGQPISLTELLYPLCQAFDSVHVRADVELGGSDQMFNLLLGREMQKAHGLSGQVCMTLPILPGVDGVKKMSKTAGNHVGIADSANEIFAKTMRLPDAAMDQWFELLFACDKPADLSARDAKRLLARSLAERWGGTGAGVSAQAAFDRVFVEHRAPQQIETFQLDDLPIPTAQTVSWTFGVDLEHARAAISRGDVRCGGAAVPAGDLPAGDLWGAALEMDGACRRAAELVPLPRLIAAAFAVSASEARRKLRDGAVKLDGKPLDAAALDRHAAALDGRVLQLGRRNFARLARRR